MKNLCEGRSLGMHDFPRFTNCEYMFHILISLLKPKVWRIINFSMSTWEFQPYFQSAFNASQHE